MSDVYDWWSRHPRAFDLLYAVAFLGRGRRIRRRPFEARSPRVGERVLEIRGWYGREPRTAP
jgi:demethylmenaquinone methyltransferase/2-methoxy-6-polyprenyl-1,4-benzoquinol methylase